MTEGPLGGAEVAALMSRLEPFERAPNLAVAVSGGADSLALAVLLHDWASSRGGRVVALTVDHGLRPGSAAEAAGVGRTLKPLGLGHHILRWRGDKPTTGVQAAARQARYALLTAWCERHGMLHLALGHHLDDQAETLLLRLGRGSGLDGLAAMAAIVELPGLRLLRPFLGVPKERLEATLNARGLSWIEDPSNRDPAYARARLRRLVPALAEEGLTASRLAAAAGRFGHARVSLDRDAALVLAQAVALHPAGYATLDPAGLAAAPGETGLRVLARVLMTVGGAAYPPRLERLERLYACIAGGLARGAIRGATLGGCRVLPWRGRLLVAREERGVPALTLRAGQSLHWDGRFEVALGRRAGALRGPITIAPLGAEGWAELRAVAPGSRKTRIPGAARPALPALRDRRGLVAVPQLVFARSRAAELTIRRCQFAPKIALTALAFTVA